MRATSSILSFSWRSGAREGLMLLTLYRMPELELYLRKCMFIRNRIMEPGVELEYNFGSLNVGSKTSLVV